MDTDNESIQVFIRIKPTINQQSCIGWSEKEIYIGKNQFTFDHIFSPLTTQENIFHSVGIKIISHVLEGYNSCIFVYGQTGSGKTYTMCGQNHGLMQNSFLHLFTKIHQINAQCIVNCSYYEIYNEQIIDLLDHRQKKMNIRQDTKKGIFVEGLLEENIENYEKLIQCLEIGMKNRHWSQTLMNKQSSRSHSIFTISLSCKYQNQGKIIIKIPKLHFVDLAGSERQKMTQSSGERLKQASNINKSLTTLGMVINALTSDRIRQHIPYRDSKLTCLLRDSLGGNSKTFIIATISTATNCFQETLSTLNFANRAKMVKVKALINQESLSNNVQLYKEEIRKLKTQILKLKSEKKVTIFQGYKENKIQQQFNELNTKMSVISQQLRSNIASSPTLSNLVNNLQSYPINEELLSDQQAEGQIVTYLNTNYEMLVQINNKINQYIAIKEDLRNLASHDKPMIEDINSTSVSERQLYRVTLQKKEENIHKLQDHLSVQSQINSIEFENIETRSNSKPNLETQESINKQIWFYKYQKQIQNNNKLELALHQHKLTLQRQKQLLEYERQKYQNEKYNNNQLIEQLSKVNGILAYYKQQNEQLRINSEQLMGQMEQYDILERNDKNQINILNDTIQFQQKLIKQHQQTIHSIKQKESKTLSYHQCQNQTNLKLIDEKQNTIAIINDNLINKNYELNKIISQYHQLKEQLQISVNKCKNLRKQYDNEIKQEKQFYEQQFKSQRQEFQQSKMQLQSQIRQQYNTNQEIKKQYQRERSNNHLEKIQNQIQRKQYKEQKQKYSNRIYQISKQVNQAKQKQCKDRERLQDIIKNNIDKVNEDKQMRKNYQQIVKENYRLKNKYQRVDAHNINEELNNKVSYYEEKFKLMSIQYHQLTQAVHKLKQKEIQQSQKISFLQEQVSNSKVNNEHTVLENEKLMEELKQIRNNTINEGKYQFNNHQLHKEDELLQKEERIRCKLQGFVRKWDELKQNRTQQMSIEELLYYELQKDRKCKQRYKKITEIKNSQQFYHQIKYLFKGSYQFLTTENTIDGKIIKYLTYGFTKEIDQN